MNPEKKGRPVLAAFLLVFCLASLYFGHGKKFFGFAWNTQEEECIPGLRLAFFVYHRPSMPAHGDLIFFSPFGALSEVKQQYVLKQVAGVPGDRIKIVDSTVFINGKAVVKGFEDAKLYNKKVSDFEIDEVIPKDRYFVVGSAQYSNDSRYWGYLPAERIVGSGYKVF